MYTMQLRRTPILIVASLLLALVVAAVPLVMAAVTASGSSAQELVYLRTRTQVGTDSPIKHEVWAKVDSQNVISKAHSVVRDSGGQALQESFYDAGSAIKTKTPLDTEDEPVYTDMDAGVQKVNYNLSDAQAAIEGLRASEAWTVVSDTEGLVTFQRPMGTNIHKVTYDKQTGMVMRTALYAVNAGGALTLIEELVVEHYERRAIRDGDSSVWTAVLSDT